MLINHNINSLNGGVTRQPQESRFDNQVEEMINFIPDVTGSISRRNPLIHVKTIGFDMFNDRTAMHSYNRGDGLEKYGMVINDGGLNVSDVDGNIKTVNIVGTNVINTWKTALGQSSPDWKNLISFLTVGDTTWILNKGITVGMTTDVTTTYSNNKAFYWAKRSFDNGQGSGYTYKIVLNGNNVQERYELGTDPQTYGYRDINSTSTTDAISRLTNAINNNYQGLYNGFSATAQQSVMRISKASSFTFTSGDSWGNEASFGWTSKVAKIADLPSKLSGFSESDVGILEITGTDKDSFTSYYLKWNGENWTESVKGGILNTFNVNTLPAKLVRQSNGTFSFGFNVVDGSHQGFDKTWALRKKGDNDSNPIPTFNGNKISNMFSLKTDLDLQVKRMLY